MKIAICDDEKSGRLSIRRLLSETKEAHEITEFSDGESLLLSAYLEYDLIFLDVSMKRMSGMEVAKAIRIRQQECRQDIWGSFPLLVFITGYREHMADAFSVHAFGYLVKPIRKSDFFRVYEQAGKEYGKRNGKNSRVLLIKQGSEVRKVQTDEILYVESEKRKNIVHMQGEEIVYYGSIGELEKELPDDFFRIHKGYLINMRYIEKYDRSQLWVRGGDCLLISKYRYADFVNAFIHYLR